MISLLILLPIGLLILNIWLWLFWNIFSITTHKNKFIIITIIMWLISWLSIVCYPYYLWYVWQNDLIFTKWDTNLDTFEVVLSFWIYLSLIVIWFKLFFFKINNYIFFLVNYIIFSVLFLSCWYFGLEKFANTILFYYMFVAIWEEFIKYLLWVAFYEKFKLIDTDLLLFAILSAIGFAFVENIVYMYAWLTWKSLILWVLWWAGVLITRWIVWFVIHILFTWNIWLIEVRWVSWWYWLKFLLFVILWVALWVILHYSYDLMLYKGMKMVVILSLIFGYFWISYLFYNSDRIYIRDWI